MEKSDFTMFLNKKHIRDFVKAKGKRIGKDAIFCLNGKIRDKLEHVIHSTGSRKTIHMDDMV